MKYLQTCNSPYANRSCSSNSKTGAHNRVMRGGHAVYTPPSLLSSIDAASQDTKHQGCRSPPVRNFVKTSAQRNFEHTMCRAKLSVHTRSMATHTSLGGTRSPPRFTVVLSSDFNSLLSRPPDLSASCPARFESNHSTERASHLGYSPFLQTFS